MNRRLFLLNCAVTAGLLPSGNAKPSDINSREPGISSSYHLDEGIENDPDVIIAEGFERENWRDKWQEISDNSRRYSDLPPKTIPLIMRELKG